MTSRGKGSALPPGSAEPPTSSVSAVARVFSSACPAWWIADYMAEVAERQAMVRFPSRPAYD